jgi:glycosyltransferase involved in cell wall biosynthesis
LQRTQEYLTKLGVSVEISHDPRHHLAGFDLVHLFNIMPVEETYQFYQNARHQHKKMVLSTIFWDPAEFLQATGTEARFGEWWQKTMPQRVEILSNVQLILPNSRMEGELLEKSFPKLPPSLIVPNSADRLFANAGAERFRKRFQPPPEFVLSVGRISPRKNQLSLVQAIRSLRLPAVFIGPLNDTVYYQECRRAAAGLKVTFIDTLSQTDLASAYAAAKVHALVSWYDTPGLVSLEAGLAGCRIVSTSRGCTREYLKEMAFYCEPDDLNSICQALQDAWCAPADQRLRERILRHYTWEQTAQATLDAYRMALDSSKS